MISQARARLAHPPGRPADRAPLALRRLADLGRNLVRGGVPDIGAFRAPVPERAPHLPADLLAHRLGAGPQQPALEVAEHLGPRCGLPRPGLPAILARSGTPALARARAAGTGGRAPGGTVFRRPASGTGSRRQASLVLLLALPGGIGPGRLVPVRIVITLV